MPKVHTLVGGLMLLTLVSAHAETTETHRLPEDIQPGFQQITLNLDPDQAEYNGSTSIELTLAENAERIGFYQSELKLDSVSLKSADGVRKLATESGEYQITWAADGHAIKAGEYVLEIEFSSMLATNALGLYQVSHEGNNYIYTQFEAMHARRAFPSFDEPAFKIPYQLTVTAPQDHVVVSNTPAEKTTRSADRQTVSFARTRPMPSYLIALAVGPMDATPIEGLSVPGVIYSPKGSALSLQEARLCSGA